MQQKRLFWLFCSRLPRVTVRANLHFFKSSEISKSDRLMKGMKVIFWVAILFARVVKTLQNYVIGKSPQPKFISVLKIILERIISTVLGLRLLLHVVTDSLTKLQKLTPRASQFLYPWGILGPLKGQLHFSILLTIQARYFDEILSIL